MPRLDAGMTSQTITGSNFTFQATRIGDLGATEYTLVTIAVDVTSSTSTFADQLREMLIATVDACRRSPRSNNLLVRVITFSTSLVGGVEEIHGFVPLVDIKTSAYPQFQPSGGTPLTDAAYSGIGAMADYGRDLMNNDFLVNGIVFVITDGEENSSRMTEVMVQRLLTKIRQDEELESIVSVLVGINAGYYKAVLQQFQKATGFDQYLDAGDVTPGRLAKLANFVSQSISSQSQALGTGGPSQLISTTI